MRFLPLCVATTALLVLPGIAMADPGDWQGRRLSEFLDRLNEQGLHIIYTSDLVTDDMLLANEPDAGDPKAALADALRPFGLRSTDGPAGSLLIVRAEPAGPAGVDIAEKPDTPIPEIVVTSSLHRLEYARPSSSTWLDRDLATRMPTVAEEAVRITARLPGTASGGVSSRNHVRGGEVNEVLFVFDGLRLYEPYHLKDFQAIATTLNASAIGGMDFYTGAYPAHFGDRMSGVMNIELREPVRPIETELAVSFFNASILSIGRFGGEQQGDWLLSARRGNLDLIVDVVNPDFGSPVYQDYLGHVAWEFGPRATISANMLVSDDELLLADPDRGEQATATYVNQVFWMKWRAEWSEVLTSDTILANSDISNRRSGVLDLPGIVSGRLDENREFSAFEFRQDWTWLMSPDHMLRFGADIKDMDARYLFSSQKTVAEPFDTILDNQPFTSHDFDLDPGGAQYAVFAELRWRLARRWTAEVGVRWDQQNYTTAEEDQQVSPRASLLFESGERTEIRFGWGHYYQAQEINELQINDGVPAFFPAQHAEHFVINLRHAFSSGINGDVSIYRKSFRTLRPHFENVFNTLTLLPELQFDRVMVDAPGAEAIGAEITLSQGASDADLFWWLSYAWSRAVDETPDADIKRSWDQTHTLKGGLSWRWGPWDFGVAAELHSGWPKTLMNGELVTQPDGSQRLVLEVTGRNTLRFTTFNTLDLHVSRKFELPRGELTAFLDVTNLYDRQNPCCTEYSLLADGALGGREAHWLPLVPSLGVVWRF